jgi:hypothetical protein
MKPLDLNAEQLTIVMRSMRKSFNDAPDAPSTRIVIEACEKMNLPESFIDELKSDYLTEYNKEYSFMHTILN